jgi:acetyl esterase/lipase
MSFFKKTSLICAASLMLGACTKAGLFLANTPAAFNSSQSYKDVAYGDMDAQKLDLYIPPRADNAPVIVFFYGGRWTDGSKSQYRFVADVFNDAGYIVAIPDYRKYPQVKFPSFVEDGAAAVDWVYKNIRAYNGDPEHVYLAGHSSGAHIGGLVTADPQYLAAHGLSRDIIKGFAGLSGPYAFVPEAEDLKDMFGPPERYPLMRAPNYIDGHQPPMLLIHGLEDTKVVLENAEKLKRAIDEKGGEVSLVTYEDLNHVETVGSLMWFWRYKSDIKEQMINFFDAHKNDKD